MVVGAAYGPVLSLVHADMVVHADMAVRMHAAGAARASTAVADGLTALEEMVTALVTLTTHRASDTARALHFC